MTTELTLTLDDIQSWVERLRLYQTERELTSLELKVVLALNTLSKQDIPTITSTQPVIAVITPQPPSIGTTIGVTGSINIGGSNTPPIVFVPTQTQLVPTSLVITGAYGANLRDKPTLNSSVVLSRLIMGETATVSDMATDSENFIWYNIQINSLVGWVREDNVRTNLQPVPTPAAPITTGKFALPVPPLNMTTPYDPNGSAIGYVHTGWDYADKTGTPVLASAAGTVVKVAYCNECGPNGLSSVDKGYPRGDSRILNDEKWNYGYGHYVIVRYDWANLPESTKTWLTGRGWSGSHAFVMYAHLSQIKVQQNANVVKGSTVGLMGNSGNSTGTHLHLELRYSNDTNSVWYKILSRVADPITLFDR